MDGSSPDLNHRHLPARISLPSTWVVSRFVSLVTNQQIESQPRPQCNLSVQTPRQPPLHPSGGMAEGGAVSRETASEEEMVLMFPLSPSSLPLHSNFEPAEAQQKQELLLRDSNDTVKGGTFEQLAAWLATVNRGDSSLGGSFSWNTFPNKSDWRAWGQIQSSPRRSSFAIGTSAPPPSFSTSS